MNVSTLEVISGSGNPLKAEEYSRYAELAGLKVIKLRHPTGFGPQPTHLRGFQGARVLIQESGAQRGYQSELTKNSNGEAAPTGLPLVFEPDRETNELIGAVIDTPFNRKRLSLLLNNNSGSFKIYDDSIHDACMKMAIENGNFQKKKKRQSEVVSNLTDENAQLRKELEEERSKRKKAEDKALVVGDALQEESKQTVKLGKKALREQVRKQVLEENKELVETLKEAYGSQYHLSSEYKAQIKPEIDRRVDLRMNTETEGTDVEHNNESADNATE